MQDSDEDEEKPNVTGELKLSDLPPIEELTISVPADNLIKVGRVISIVDVLVVIESIKSMPPLDLDTVLFKHDGKPIGKIFDVFGPVSEPHYSVRFNTIEQIGEKEIQKETAAYFVPEVERNITKFVFVNELKKIKGTDASWENDTEPPENVVEYSDDEEEQVARRRERMRKRSLREFGVSA